jgi:hypothetical protein
MFVGFVGKRYRHGLLQKYFNCVFELPFLNPPGFLTYYLPALGPPTHVRGGHWPASFDAGAGGGLFRRRRSHSHPSHLKEVEVHVRAFV